MCAKKIEGDEVEIRAILNHKENDCHYEVLWGDGQQTWIPSANILSKSCKRDYHRRVRDQHNSMELKTYIVEYILDVRFNEAVESHEFLVQWGEDRRDCRTSWITESAFVDPSALMANLECLKHHIAFLHKNIRNPHESQFTSPDMLLRDIQEEVQNIQKSEQKARANEESGDGTGATKRGAKSSKNAAPPPAKRGKLVNGLIEKEENNQSSVSEGEDKDEDDDEFEVEHLIAVRLEPIGGKRGNQQKVGRVLVKWKGYSHSDNSWEPPENLHCKEAQALLDARIEADKKRPEKAYIWMATRVGTPAGQEALPDELISALESEYRQWRSGHRGDVCKVEVSRSISNSLHVLTCKNSTIQVNFMTMTDVLATKKKKIELVRKLKVDDAKEEEYNEEIERDYY